jgi:hypothetical protein
MQMDMSDQAVSPNLIKPGQTQLEACYMHTIFRDEPVVAMNPSVLLRYGINRIFEAQLMFVDGTNRDIFVEKTSQGTYPLAFVVKTSLLNKDEKTKLGIVTMVKLPFTSHTSEQQRYWSPAVAIAFEQQFGKLDFTINTGILLQAFEYEWQFPLNAAAELPVGDHFSFFVNYYSQFGIDDLPQHNAGGGIEYHFNPRFALFVSSGSTLNPKDSNFYYSGGLSASFN